MRFRKADEMERHQSDQAAKYGFVFFTISLLIWSLYDFFVKGNSGWQFTILMLGCVLYSCLRVFYHKKTNA